MRPETASILAHVEHLFSVEQRLREAAIDFNANKCHETRAALRAAAVAYANAANVAEDAIHNATTEVSRG